MGNNDPRKSKQLHEELQQVQSNGRQRAIGLTPSDGQDAYKRSSNRSSRRSRSERTSYLVATGHLDLEETQQLNRPTRNDDELFGGRSQFANENKPVSASNPKLESNDSPLSATSPTNYAGAASSSGDQAAFLNFVSSKHSDTHDNNIFAHNSFNTTPNSKSKGSMRGNSNKKKNNNSTSNNKGKFRQTYTEVTLPMNTSPAFEYILKDNKRRNRRCCLKLLYSTLCLILIAIIVFCSTLLAIRYLN